MVDRLDLNSFEEAYEDEGRPAYAPELLVAVWLYAYALGVTSSRGWSSGSFGDTWDTLNHSATGGRWFTKELRSCCENRVETDQPVAGCSSGLKR